MTLLALDHRQNLRRDMAPRRPAGVSNADLSQFKQQVVQALASAADAVLLDPETGVAHCIQNRSLPGSTGVIVAVEATGYEGPSTCRVSRVLPDWSVEKARRTGASAAKLLLYYHPEAANAAAQEQLVRSVADACRRQDLPLLLEVLSYSVDAAQAHLHGLERRRVITQSARRLGGLGADLLKLEFPSDAAITEQAEWREACQELTTASQVPWVLLSGGVGHESFIAQVEVAGDAGAIGVAAGRAIWREAVLLEPAERDTFLATTGMDRLQELRAAVEGHARAWFDREPWSAPSPVVDGWYASY